jgi:hypothetical protein
MARRILVSPSPRLLADLVAALLREVGVDEVHPRRRSGDEPFDAAIVPRRLVDRVDAQVVIGLPDHLSESDTTLVCVAGAPPREAEAATLTDILELLDEHCPAPGGLKRSLPVAIDPGAVRGQAPI